MRYHLNHILVLAILPFLSGCAKSNLAAHSRMDLVSRIAVKHCVNFYDEVNGAYKITDTRSGFVYRGSPEKRSRMHEGTIIEVDNRGQVISIISDDNIVYPLSILNKDREEYFCIKYGLHHDSKGRELMPGWDIYY